MRSPRILTTVFIFIGIAISNQSAVRAQCCLSGLFSGCGCFKTAVPAYAVAPVPAPPPVTPIMAPAVMAPAVVAPPPQPVMVPVQQVSYVPETTYQTKYQCVPVTCYRPSCEIDPCTGCAVECMEQVTNYVQKQVSVPVTQYRAVYTTKYVQVQPGASAPGVAGSIPGPAGVATSPFATPSQTTPQAWGAAGTAASPSVPTQQPILPPSAPSSTYQQQIVPQSGNYAPTQQNPVPLQPMNVPALTPAPSLKPIPELTRDASGQQSLNSNSGSFTAPNSSKDTSYGQPNQQQAGNPTAIVPSPSLRPIPPATSSSTSNSRSSYGTPLRGNSDMPVLPGNGPTTTTRAFPKLLEPTGHTTSWKPASQRITNQPHGSDRQNSWQPAFTKVPSGTYAQGWQPTYPTAALPTTAQ